LQESEALASEEPEVPASLLGPVLVAFSWPPQPRATSAIIDVKSVVRRIEAASPARSRTIVAPRDQQTRRFAEATNFRRRGRAS
jgi:hypothetical protein